MVDETRIKRKDIAVRRRLFEHVMARSYRHTIDVNRNRYDDFRFPPVVHPSVADARLDALPLGAPILKPDLHLPFRQAEIHGDLRSFGEREVLLGVELVLERDQLLAREGGSSPAFQIALVVVIHHVNRRRLA